MRLAVIDDHDIVIQGIHGYAAEMPKPVTVDGFPTMEAFERAHAAGARFNLVLLDLSIPGFSGLAALQHFRAKFPDIPVAVLSATSDPDIIWEALENVRAVGFIPKTSGRDAIVEAIGKVLNGFQYWPPDLRESLHARAAGLTRRPLEQHERETAKTDARRARILASLTTRQRDVLLLLMEGMPDKRIAQKLGISPETVKSHNNGIFRALNVSSRILAVIEAERLGMRVEYDDADAR